MKIYSSTKRWFGLFEIPYKLILIFSIVLSVFFLKAYSDMRQSWLEEVEVGGHVILVNRVAELSCVPWMLCDGVHEVGGSVEFKINLDNFSLRYKSSGGISPIYLGLIDGVPVLSVLDWSRQHPCISSYQLYKGGGGVLITNHSFPDVNLYINPGKGVGLIRLARKPGFGSLFYERVIQGGQVDLNCGG